MLNASSPHLISQRHLYDTKCTPVAVSGSGVDTLKAVESVQMHMRAATESINVLLADIKNQNCSAQGSTTLQKRDTLDRFLDLLKQSTFNLKQLTKSICGQSPTVYNVCDMLELTLKHLGWLHRDLIDGELQSNFLKTFSASLFLQVAEAVEILNKSIIELQKNLPENLDLDSSMIATTKGFRTAITDLHEAIMENCAARISKA